MPILGAQLHCPPHTSIHRWKALDVYFPMQLEAHHLEFYNSSYTPWKVKRSAGLIACWYYALLCTLRGCFLPQFLVSTMHAIYAWKALDVFFPMHFESPHLEFCSSSYSCWSVKRSGLQILFA